MNAHVTALLCGLVGLVLSAAAEETELIGDPSFQRGFVLLRPETGKKVECGTVLAPDAKAAAWQLAQWSSKNPLDGTTPLVKAASGGLRLSNPARSVSFGGNDGILTLAVNTAEEYGDRPRAEGEPWVHLLVEQPIARPPRLGDLHSLRLQLEARKIRARLARADGHDPERHAAQFLLFLSLQNLEKDSPGYGNYLWFGVPIFDNRHRTSETYSAQDFGGTGKFIHTPATKHFTAGSTHDAGWVKFNADLLPLIREGLAVARSKGFLKGTDGDDLLRVAAMNMGWEVPGTFDVEMQVRGLSLISTPR